MKYDVHVFAVVRVKYSGVEADSQKQAICRAVDFKDLHSRFLGDDYEFAEEISHYLVDEVGDEEYNKSQFYIDRAHHLGDEQSIKDGTELVDSEEEVSNGQIDKA